MTVATGKSGHCCGKVGEEGVRGGGVAGGGGVMYLVEGAVLVILGETVLLQEIILQEASRLQGDLVPLSQRILRHQPTIAALHLFWLRLTIHPLLLGFCPLRFDLAAILGAKLAFQSALILMHPHP